MAEHVKYPPLLEVRKSFRVNWYRSPINPKTLRQLMQRSNSKGLLLSAGNLILFTATASLTFYFYNQHFFLAFVLSLFFHCTCSCFLSSACHELVHGTVFKSKFLNRLFLIPYSLLSWFNPPDYSLSHAYHHRYTLHPKGDREIVLPDRPTFHWFYLTQLLTINITGGPMSRGLLPTLRKVITAARGKPLLDDENDAQNHGKKYREWSESLYAAHPEERHKSVLWAWSLILFHAGILITGTILEIWLLPVLISLQFFIANWWRYLIFLPMHCGLRDNVPDFRKCVRTIKIDPFTAFLYWQMNWHLEHHMYAGVPCYNLKKVSAVIKNDLPKPRSLIGAWKEMRYTWRRQQKEPEFQFDTPLPENNFLEKPSTETGLNDSIGDLGPKTL